MATKDSNTERGSDTYAKERWYQDDLDNLKDSTRQLLETYSKIPPEEVIPHVHAVRDRAWAIHPYPCIGQWRFLDLSIGSHALYQSGILPRMLTGQQTYLDLGCAFGQDIRRLVADGVPSQQCYGSDLRLDFLELGYDLFRDRETLKTRFIEGDVFDANSQLRELDGKLDIIGASSFFHLFSWDEQKQVAHRVVKLLKPKRDSLLVGRQVGTTVPGEYVNRSGTGTRYRHNIESWRRMWDEVGKEAAVEFQVNGKLREMPDTIKACLGGNKAGWRPEDEKGMRMEFSVRRIS